LPPTAVPAVNPGIIGNFGGSFTGVEHGTFVVTVASNGLVTGSGSASQSGPFNVSGRADPTGNLSLTASGSAGTAVYSGRIDGATGVVAGNWRYAQLPGGGSFSGQRQ
jgi:hypothetical protein